MITPGNIFGREIIVLLLYGLLECNALLLHQPLTNNQIRNNQMSADIFLNCYNSKKEETALPDLFYNCNSNKKRWLTFDVSF